MVNRSYAETCDLVLEVLRANADGIGVDPAAIEEGKTGTVGAPPFLYVYLTPQENQVLNDGSSLLNMLEVVILVGVASGHSAAQSLRDAMLLAGRVLTVIEQDRELQYSGTNISFEERNANSTIVRLNFVVEYNPNASLLL